MSVTILSDTRSTGTEVAFQQCINPACRTKVSIDRAIFECPNCADLLDVAYDWDRAEVPSSLKWFEKKWAQRTDPENFSGVWRFRELLPFVAKSQIVTIGEGQTLLQRSDPVASYVGVQPGGLLLQYEGMNPSGSFKDNGMAAAFTHARMVGAKRVACASTGNTSASLAVFCSSTTFGFKAIIFIGSGKIAYGKLSQALDHGALTIQIVGDFDDALERVRQVAGRLGIYLMNSVNPFRLEGQKTIMFRILEAMNWEVPDWIVVPGGNLGNSSSFGKAFIEMKHLGLIDKVPRLAIINAAGAHTLDQLVSHHGLTWRNGLTDPEVIDNYYGHLDREHLKADTIASAIEINRPVNLKNACEHSTSATAHDRLYRCQSQRPELMLADQILQGHFGLMSPILWRVRVNHRVVDQISVSVKNSHFTPGAEAWIDRKNHLGSDWWLQQEAS